MQRDVFRLFWTMAMVFPSLATPPLPLLPPHASGSVGSSRLCSRKWLTHIAVYEANRSTRNPNPKPIRHKQPLVSIGPFLSYWYTVAVYANPFLEYVVSSTGLRGQPLCSRAERHYLAIAPYIPDLHTHAVCPTPLFTLRSSSRGV